MKEPTIPIDIKLHTGPRSVSPRRTKPDLSALIEHQASGGHFNVSVEEVLKQFFRDNSVVDATVQAAFNQCMANQKIKAVEGYAEKNKKRCLYLTLVALYVLEHEFADRQ